MKKYIFVLVMMCTMLILSSCTQEKVDAQSKVETSSKIISSSDKLNQIEYIPFDPLHEPPIMENIRDVILPEFFSKEQEKVYKQCFGVFELFSGSPYSIDYIPLSNPKDMPNVYETIIFDDVKYVYANGRYTNWNDFYNMCMNVFSEDYFSELNSFEISKPYQGVKMYNKFMEYNGRLCFRDAEAGSTFGYDSEKFPDEYELISSSDDVLEFNIIAHYYVGGENSDDVRILKLPCSMIKTENGWRIDSFISPSQVPFEIEKEQLNN